MVFQTLKCVRRCSFFFFFSFLNIVFLFLFFVLFLFCFLGFILLYGFSANYKYMVNIESYITPVSNFTIMLCFMFPFCYYSSARLCVWIYKIIASSKLDQCMYIIEEIRLNRICYIDCTIVFLSSKSYNQEIVANIAFYYKMLPYMIYQPSSCWFYFTYNYLKLFYLPCCSTIFILSLLSVPF